MSSIVAIIAASQPMLKDAFPKIGIALTKSIGSFSENVGPNSTYVSRQLLEDKILRIYLTPITIKRGDYHIVIGPNGAGKSSVVARVLNGKESVVKLIISDGDTMTSVLSRVFTKCGLVIEPNAQIDLDSFLTILRITTLKNPQKPVTFVFEVERGSSSPEILSLIKHLSKELALSANVIIILSEANAGLGFCDDDGRKNIWVDEMTESEAITYANKINPNISIDDIKLFISKVGARPLKIRQFAEDILDGKLVQDIIGKALFDAEGDLAAFLHQPILTAIKKSPSGGVLPRIFTDVTNEGILLSAPKQVALAMKEQNAIVYHFPSGEYRPFSTAHKTALKNYRKGLFNNF